MTGAFGLVNPGYGTARSSTTSSSYRPPQGVDRYRLEPGPNANQWRIVDLYTTATYARLTDTSRPAAARLVAALNHHARAGR